MFRLAGGRRMNHLRRAWRAPSFDVGTSDPIFPPSAAYDHRCGSAAMFADTAENSTIVCDKDVLVDGDFSTDPLEGWIVDSGSIDATGFYNGASVGRQDIQAVPGEILSLYLSLIIQEGGGEFQAQLRNLHTGRWLKADLTWSDVAVDFVDTDAGFTQFYAFRVEPFSECRANEVTLRLTMTGDNISPEAALWPHTDLACVFGYNHPPGGLIASVENGSLTWSKRFLRDHGTKVLWSYLGECKSDRVLRFKWAGTPLAPIGFGELVLTQTTKIARSNVPGGVAPRLDMELDGVFAQERATAPSGALYVSPNGGDAAPRQARMSFMLTAESELSRLRDEIFSASLGGLYPSILVGPTAIGPEVCMMGRFENRLPQSYPGGPGVVYCKVELGFQEDVFPTFSTPVLT